MNFDLDKSIEILNRTPEVYSILFSHSQYDWHKINEGPNTWSAYNIIGHLIHGEETDWIPRARIILSNVPNKTFIPFDRFAQDKLYNHQSIDQLLIQFRILRLKNIETLRSWKLSDEDLDKTGIHPDLGLVSLRQLIATWTTHDMAHLHQISRTLVKHYTKDVGPWQKYSRIMQEANKK